MGRGTALVNRGVVFWDERFMLYNINSKPQGRKALTQWKKENAYRMKRSRSVETRLTGDMVDQIKRLTFYATRLRRSEWMPVSVSRGLNYYKRSGWEVGEDIISTKPEKHVYELFVGIDSEYVRECVWEPLEGDDLYHSSLSSKHVKGNEARSGLNPDIRQLTF